MTPKRLYDFPFSGNGYKVRLALSHLGLQVEYRIVDLLAGETSAPEFLARNPMGQIPVLELDDGTCMPESNAILLWLTDGTPLMPADGLGRARVVQWMCFEQSNIDKVLGRTRFLKRYPDFRSTTPEEWSQWYATGYRALDVMESELARRDFLVGDRYSAADICLYGYVHCAEDGGFSLERYPAVSSWRERVREQPGHVSIDDVGPTTPRAAAPARVPTEPDPRLSELGAFLRAAKRATYAALGDDASVAPLLPDSKQLEYEEGPYHYRDIYLGMFGFAGQEVVSFQGRAVWSMVYSGGLLPGTPASEGGAVYRALRAALSAVPPELPLRGPSAHELDGLRYVCATDGALGGFHGHEIISRQSQALYALRFSGGWLT